MKGRGGGVAIGRQVACKSRRGTAGGGLAEQGRGGRGEVGGSVGRLRQGGRVSEGMTKKASGGRGVRRGGVRDGSILVVDGIRMKSCKGTTRPPYEQSVTWQALGKPARQKKIAEAIDAGLYWGDYVKDAAVGTLFEQSSVSKHFEIDGLGMACLETTLAKIDPQWAMYCLDHGLTQDGDLAFVVGEVIGQSHDAQFGEKPGHRDKLNVPETGLLWNACVTKQVHPNEPMYHCPKAKFALNKELCDLRERKVWDEEVPIEASEAMMSFPNAHFARIFAILGVKNSEMSDPGQHIFKARVVLGGDNIRTTRVQYAIFEDVGSTPATMAAARTLMAINAAMPHLKLQQSDCVRAYVQAELPKDIPPTFVRLPRAWHPKSWAKFKDPVCRLRMALYGHPKAGDIWTDRFRAVAEGRNFKTVEGWPSVYVKVEGAEVCVIVVYVDDLLILGGDLADREIREIRKIIEMDDPAEVGKYLGCGHSTIKRQVGKDVLTKYIFDMSEYFKSSCDIFVSETGIKLKHASSPSPPDIAHAELIKLI